MPQKPVTLLNDFEDIALGSNPGDRSKFIDRMKRSGKQHPIQNSTNIVTWALLEAIETAKEE